MAPVTLANMSPMISKPILSLIRNEVNRIADMTSTLPRLDATIIADFEKSSELEKLSPKRLDPINRSATPNPEPLLSPNTYGPASGFLKYVCINSPLSPNPDPTKIAVIGGGSWATALVKMLCNNAQTVNWWMRNEGAVGHLIKYQHNPNYLQSVEFNLDKINVSTNLIETIKESDIIIIATPSAFLVDLFKELNDSSGLSFAYSGLGIVYYDRGEKYLALENYLTSEQYWLDGDF